MEEIRLNAVVPLSQERAFSAFYKTELLIVWLVPENVEVTAFSSDFVEGGEFKAHCTRDNQQYHITGEFASILSGEKLMFSLRFPKKDGVEHEATVDVRFSKAEDGCEITLHHAGLLTQQEAAIALNYWQTGLDKLAHLPD